MATLRLGCRRGGDRRVGVGCRPGDVPTGATRAVCATQDPDLLFVTGAAQREATKMCRGCPVKLECLADALDNEVEFGVWGGPDRTSAPGPAQALPRCDQLARRAGRGQGRRHPLRRRLIVRFASPEVRRAASPRLAAMHDRSAGRSCGVGGQRGDLQHLEVRVRPDHPGTASDVRRPDEPPRQPAVGAVLVHLQHPGGQRVGRFRSRPGRPSSPPPAGRPAADACG